MRLEISREVLATITAHVDAEHPCEACGLLFGSDGRITSCRPCANVAVDPRRHFEIDPAALLAAHRAMRSGGPRLIGHYHSHPLGDPMPSATDAASATPDGSYWLIAPGRAGAATERALPAIWRAVAGGKMRGVFEPVELITFES